MKRMIILLLLGTLMVSVGWLFGCGSSSSTDPAPKVAGDTSSVEFQTASDVLYSAEEIDGMVIEGTLELIGSFMAPAAPREVKPASAADPVFHENSMYWYRVETATETTFVSGHPDSIQNISEWVRIDSLQFLHLDTPKMFPDPELLTEIKAGVQMVGHAQLTNDSIRASRYVQMAGAAGSLANRGDITVNANGSTVAGLAVRSTRRDTLTECQVALNMSSQWQNLAVNLAAVMDSNKCPTSGTITWSGSLNVACTRGDDSVNFNGGWTAMQIFNGDQVTHVFENATTRWTVTGTCGDQAVTSPFQRHSNPLQ